MIFYVFTNCLFESFIKVRYGYTGCWTRTNALWKSIFYMHLSDALYIKSYDVNQSSWSNSFLHQNFMNIDGTTWMTRVTKIGIENSSGKWILVDIFLSKRGNSSGHFHRVNSSGNFSWIFVDIYCPREFLFFGEFLWTFLGWILVDTFFGTSVL